MIIVKTGTLGPILDISLMVKSPTHGIAHRLIGLHHQKKCVRKRPYECHPICIYVHVHCHHSIDKVAFSMAMSPV